MMYDKIILMYRMGLGFYNRNNNLKFVRYGSRTNIKPAAEIYSLITDSWRVISSPRPLKHYYRSLKSVLCGGYYFWKIYGLKNNFILCFNLIDEVFFLIPLLDVFHQQNKSWTFSAVDEQLSIIVYPTSTIEPLIIEL